MMHKVRAPYNEKDNPQYEIVFKNFNFDLFKYFFGLLWVIIYYFFPKKEIPMVKEDINLMKKPILDL